jgi:glyoxylase-like metal-dependent hydrolase (beta-lactamase superfamily II)
MSTNSIELGHGITQVDAEYMAPGVAAVYLMQQGNEIAIIETGTAFTVSAILETLEQKGLGAEHVTYVIPTHVHLDHAGGVGELMDVCPNARLVIHPRGARHMIDPSKLEQGTIAVYGEAKFRQFYGELKPVAEERVIQAPDNFTLDFNGRVLTFLDTPGHARHHFCVYDEESRGIFSGDTFGLSYPQLATEQGPFIFPTTTPVQFEPEAMKASIDRLMALEPQSIYLTHFGRIAPSESLVTQLKDGIDAFTDIAHSEKEADERLTRISERMMDYLLTQLHKMGCAVEQEDCRRILQNDVTLNSQGLEVWLEKQA